MPNPSQPTSDTPVRPEISFEFDSFAWWKRTGFLLIGILIVIGGYILFVGSSRSTGGKRPDLTEAVSNARQIGLALFEFQTEYGRIPDPSTIEKVRQNYTSDLLLATKASNDFFRQLIVCEIVQSESMFYARIKGTRKPDNVISGTKALEKGECGFTYFTGATEASTPGRPIAAAPMIPGTNRFDPKPFQGKAVVLRADNSVKTYQIMKQSGHIMEKGQNLMDPQHPVWQGNAPIIAWPDL